MASVTYPTSSEGTVPFYKTRRFNDLMRDIVVYSLLLLLSIVFLFPFYWMVSTALKAEHNVFIWPPQWIPDPLCGRTLERR